MNKTVENTSEKELIDSFFVESELIKIKDKTLLEINKLDGKIPYMPNENMNYDDQGKKDISWWTNGFWGGINWQLYNYYKNVEFKNTAQLLETRLDAALVEFEHLHHDVGFMWLPTSVMNYKLFGDRRSFQRSIQAANILAARFNHNGKFLRAWNSEQTSEDCTGWAIIDSMMNIPLLYWASNELKDPRFSQIASAHADTIAEYLIRDDGSVSHIGIFDPDSGDFIKKIAGQGYSDESAWSRGQGWAIYGFSLAYKYTKNQYYLDIAKSTAHYSISQLVLTDYLAKIDFKAPYTNKDYDASASAIIACGLLEISNHVSDIEKTFYRKHAIKILEKLSKIANYNEDQSGILINCAVKYHGSFGKNSSLIYADYFYIEGLLKTINSSVSVW